MKDEYIKYQDYKESEVQFINFIPHHWETWKVTHGFSKIGSGTTPKSDNPDFYNGEIPWITTSELREGLITDTNQKITQLALQNVSSLKLYNPGAIAIAMYGATIGRLGILGIESTVNQACCVYDNPSKFYPKFLFYWLWMSRKTLIAFSAGGGQPNLSQDDLKQLRIPIPEIPEQTKIAHFLDQKTGQIDRLIAQKEKLLKLLGEKRTAIITQAVTKGLAPNVEMKDSGIDWLGEIPKHWEVKPLKFVVKLINEKLDELGDLPYMGLEHIESWTSKRIFDENAKADGVVSKFQPKDVLFGKLRPYLAKVYLSDFEGGASTEALVLRSGDEVVPGFLMYYLVSDLLIDAINSSTYGSKMPRASWNFIGRLPIVLPNPNTQYEIVNYLSKKIEKLDKSIHKINESINQLKEYHEALITAAVTGQIDVRKEVVNE